MHMNTIKDVANMIGETYSRVWHAYAYGRVPAPPRVGRTFVLTNSDVVKLQAYFSGKRKRMSKDQLNEGTNNRSELCTDLESE